MITIYRKLGELLVSLGEISNLQLSIALAAQESSSRRLGEILVERGFTTEETIARCLAEQYNYPLVDPRSVQPAPGALAAVDLETALTMKVLPMAISEDQFECAIADPLDVIMTDHLATTLHRRIVLHVAPESALLRSIRESYGLRDEGAAGTFPEADLAPARFQRLVPRFRVGDVAFFDAFDSQLLRPVGLLVTPERSRTFDEHMNLVRSAARVRSPHVCTIYDSFSHGEMTWSVAEPLRGETLERILRTRGKRSAAQAAVLVAQVAEAVDRLQQGGNDASWICPGNVVVDGDRTILAPLAHPPGEYSVVNSVASRRVGFSPELFALATLLWQCVGGEGACPEERWRREAADLDVPPAMFEIFDACLALGSGKRFGSPIQLAGDLRSYNWTSVATTSIKSTGKERDQLLDSIVDVNDVPRRTSFWSRVFPWGESRRAA
jgi:hypothetical protein